MVQVDAVAAHIGSLRIATRHRVALEAHHLAVIGRLIDREVGTEQLCAAGQHGVAPGSVVVLRFLQIRIGACTHQVAGLDQLGDVIGRAVVALDEGRIVFARHRIGETHPAAQRRVAGQVTGAGSALVEQEHHLAACLGQRRPAMREHARVERRRAAAYLVGTDVFAGFEDRAHFGIQRVHRLCIEGFGLHGGKCQLDRRLLGFEQDEDGHVARVLLRPAADFLQAGNQGLAVAALIQILHMHDLEAGPVHHSGGRARRCGRQPGLGDLRDDGRVCVAPTLCIGEDVQFELAHAIVKLLRQGGMAVIQCGKQGRVQLLQQRRFAGRKAGVVAVVAADVLQVGQARRGVRDKTAQQ
ncbi:hypothetical protein XAP6164_610013 [Xanthomonas phaseoli pv. phaseoli]|nr:hypothetical protein XAP6164_610013 [Xanthomonas phaseoli pv. phaseoli]